MSPRKATSSAPCSRACARQASSASRLAWMSANKASFIAMGASELAQRPGAERPPQVEEELGGGDGVGQGVVGLVVGQAEPAPGLGQVHAGFGVRLVGAGEAPLAVQLVEQLDGVDDGRVGPA